jgi:uncharacterized protein DUF6492
MTDDARPRIVIPALAAHLEILKSSIPRIQRLFGVLPTLVTPDPASLDSLHVEVTADSDYSTVGKAAVRDMLPEAKKPLAGWYYQQILKYEIVLKSHASEVLILDADTILLTGVPPPRRDDFAFPCSSERHAPYFRAFEALTGLRRRLRKSAIVNFMWFSRRHVAELADHIESHCAVDWRKAILHTGAGDTTDCSYSEYETYGNWCAHRLDRVTQTPFRLFRRGDLLVSGSRPIESIAREAERLGYDAIAFESLHRTTAARRVVARGLFAAGLCLNFRKHS